jgi:hypothetical protein
MSSQTFHQTTDRRIWKINAGEQFEPRIIESFDPVTQKLYQHLPAMIHTKIYTRIKTLEEVSEDFSNRRSFCSCLFLRTGAELVEQKNLRRDQHLA